MWRRIEETGFATDSTYQIPYRPSSQLRLVHLTRMVNVTAAQHAVYNQHNDPDSHPELRPSDLSFVKKYTEEGTMPPLPGGSRPGRSCVCVFLETRECSETTPAVCVVTCARTMHSAVVPSFARFVALPSCSHEQLAGQMGIMRVSSDFCCSSVTRKSLFP